ncbi:hypothetical protein C4565_03560, partial [Candidatus Parcubacteria bacterium]
GHEIRVLHQNSSNSVASAPRLFPGDVLIANFFSVTEGRSLVCPKNFSTSATMQSMELRITGKGLAKISVVPTRQEFNLNG